ncbi:MAG: tyrosine-protein phosphatase [Spirochaetaceae bacterium]|nr:tyrosine-protein phosphatase [Spirochaetaceae bacterium]
MNKQQQQRIINLQGTYNFREMGGYETQDGKKTKWSTIYRADELSRLSEEDLEILRSFNIKTIIDFRAFEETEKVPDRKPTTVQKVFNIPIVFGSMEFLIKNIEKTGEKLMMQINSSAIEEAQNQFKEFFKIISDSSNLPIVFHCAGGKDRTGIASALFLSSLGVDREIIYKDYLLTAELIQKKYFSLMEKNPKLAPGFTVKREYLGSAFDTMESKYGGVESYLTKQLGVDLQLMKSIYTE